MKQELPSREIKENLSQKEIAFAFIKPDFLNDLPEIIKILKDHGLEIIYQDRVKLSPRAIDFIYQESMQEHFYQAMKNYLTDNEVIVLLVGGEGTEAQKVLLSLKKDNGKDGIIRQRLQKHPQVSAEDLNLWNRGQHPNQDGLSIVLTQKNVIHTADNTEEALKSLREILGDKFELMKKKGNLPAELWEIFKD